ncbi:SGNH/GDSL hydrolase family protein [Methylobacterium mesophilicum SR1.6/6]|uniref:SGNH/GDSL hydrolase family protein n=1 Tax=Methylobacterium mesophilicum SR1.6/6 TaxID=908290 RepID=A0A6B9FX42_9HYPH|nr:hypothetical protein [Methylobacterium mesophilicum]QGY05194.1 SGNH/GDSL hydrolase family protein [Methylobacterium mesophilicum SR1.6/6]
MSRAIRLKEYAPCASSRFSPPDWYMNQVNSSFVRKEFVINTDQNGFIKPYADSADSERSIIVLGDSVVESMYMDESLRICAMLDKYVNQQSDHNLRVLNAGYSGATLLHAFNVLLNKIVPLNPTAVVIMTGIVDVDVIERKASFWTNDKWLEPIITLDRDNPSRDNDLTDDLRIQHRFAILNMFKCVSVEFGIPIWFATVPHQQNYNNDWVKTRMSETDFKKTVVGRRFVNNSTRIFCIKNDIPFFDLELSLLDRDDIFYDFFHFNELGGSVAAQAFIDGGLVGHLNEVLR